MITDMNTELDKLIDSHLQDIRAGHDSKLKAALQAYIGREVRKGRVEELETLQRMNWITNQLYHGKGVIELSTLISVLDKRLAALNSPEDTEANHD